MTVDHAGSGAGPAVTGPARASASAVDPWARPVSRPEVRVVRGRAPLRRELEHNRRLFDAAVRTARQRASAGRYRSALEWCRVASSYAMTNPVGHLRSSALEDVVDVVAQAALEPGPGRTASAGGRRHVVHVLTEAGAVGGLTRLVARWIARDRESVSSVVVSRQPEVADSLAIAVRASGGTAVALGPDTADALERARRLREHVQGADTVICHLHSDDVAAAAAFGLGYDGPPVAVYNHADHLFWLAPSATELVVDARRVGRTVSREARGCPDRLSFVLPLPIPRVGIDADRSQRGHLGVRDDEVMAISVARQIKFQDTRLRPAFGELVAAMLEENSGLVFCAVGPDAGSDPWPALRHRFGRRIVLPGAVADPTPYLAAADLYVDTFPFSSTTSLLEATAAALPAVTLDAHDRLAAVLGLADFLPEAADRPRDVDGLLDRVAALVGSAELRSTSGAAARHGYLARTQEEPWLRGLALLYERMDEVRATGAVLRDWPSPATTDDIADLSLALLAVEQSTPLLWSMSGSLSRFDQAESGALRRRVLVSRIERRMRTALGASPWPADRVLVNGAWSAGGGHDR